MVGDDRLLMVRGEEAVMGSLLGRLEAREEAARVRVEELRAEMAALAGRLAAEEELLSRLQITRQTVIEVLAGGDLPGEGDEGAVVAGVGGGVASALASQGVASSPGRQYRGWVRRLRPSRRVGMGGSCRWPTGTWWRFWPIPAGRCGPSRSALRWEQARSHGMWRGCGPSSSGWSSVAGRPRSSRGCSRVLLALL